MSLSPPLLFDTEYPCIWLFQMIQGVTSVTSYGSTSLVTFMDYPNDYLVITDTIYQNHRYVVKYHPCFSTSIDIKSPPWVLFTVLVMIPHCTFITQVPDQVLLQFISVQYSIIKSFLIFFFPMILPTPRFIFLVSYSIYFINNVAPNNW